MAYMRVTNIAMSFLSSSHGTVELFEAARSELGKDKIEPRRLSLEALNERHRRAAKMRLVRS
jgi:hypothetical protein